MSEIIPIAYLWSFDRNEWDMTNCDTISVGVFQYLPKADGKGFKRSKSIRVKGYGAYPNKVYEKAAELCAEFNEKKLRFESLPSWVQKQYSVPKPADRVEHKPEGNDSAKVRQIRAQVAKETLLPLGFIKCKGASYVRRHGQQLHLVNFQGSMWGGQYTINLGFHYDFIPPYTLRKPIKLDQVQYLDCAVGVRIGWFDPSERDIWYPYGDDVETLRTQLRENIALSLKAFKSIEEKANDPTAWFRTAFKDTPWKTSFPQRLCRLIAIHLGDQSVLEKYEKLPKYPMDECLIKAAQKRPQTWILP